MPSICRYCNYPMQRIGTQIMEILCDWHCYVVFHASGVQATCTIKSIVNLQNLLGIMLVLRAVFNTKLLPQSNLLSIQPKSETSTPKLSYEFKFHELTKIQVMNSYCMFHYWIKYHESRILNSPYIQQWIHIMNSCLWNQIH